MAIFFNKRVLTEKVSKMFDLIGNYAGLLDRIVFITNEHTVLLYEDNDTKCVVVLTFFPLDLYENNNFIKLGDFYKSARENFLDYEGIAFNKFVTSNFREILTSDINDDKIWLVIEKLCQLGSLTKEGIVSFLNGEKDEFDAIGEIQSKTSAIQKEIKENSFLIKNSMFLDKHGSNVRVIND